jgi:lipopolysaccharide export LptBFGC system permease protein LptF
LRSGPIRGDTPAGYLWLASPNQTLYSYKFDALTGAVRVPTLYKFDPQGIFLQEVIWGSSAKERLDGSVVLEGASLLKLLPVTGGKSEQTHNGYFINGQFVDEITPFQIFKPPLKKLGEYRTSELSVYLSKIGEQEPSSELITFLTIGLWRRRIDPISPLIMWVNGLPLALTFGRRSAMVPLLFAVAIGVLYWLGTNLFTQIGSHGLLPPAAAVLGLPFLFLLTGVYFFSRAKT